MSNTVLAPSATMLTVSNASSDWNEQLFLESAERAAERRIKGVNETSMTRERQMLNRNKLVTAVCSDYRAHFASVYGKTDRLPSEIFAKVEKAVDTIIARHLAQVNSTNVISLRRFAHVNVNDMEVTERVTTTGENKMTLKEQHLFINIAIRNAEQKLTDLQKKPTPALDKEKEVKIRIVKLQQVLAFIDGEIAHQAKAAETTAQ